jgi:hypothetical protein
VIGGASTLALGPVNVHYLLLLGLIGAGAVDLGLRWFSFGRIESVALDLSIFTFLYSLVAWVWHDGSKSDWGPKTLIGLACVVLLTAAHGVVYRTRLRGELLRNLTDRITDVVDVESRGVARQLGRLLERVIPLTIELGEDGIRQGKRRIRQEAADLLNALLPLLGATQERVEDLAISEKSFLLPFRTRFPLYVLFLVFGIVSLVTPAVSWGR